MGRLGLGCVQLGSVRAGMDLATSVRLVHRALDRDITWFDTADVYTGGNSEHILGRALRGRRDRVHIVSKGGYVADGRGALARRARLLAATAVRLRGLEAPAANGSALPGHRYARQDFDPRHLTSALEGSLRRLRTDHIDVYLLHGFDTPPEVASDLLAWGEAAREAGKIGRLGVAAETPAQAVAANGCPEFTAAMVPFGVLDPECGAAVIPAAHADGRIVLSRGVLGSGLLGSAPGPMTHPKAPVVARLREFAAAAGVSPFELALWFVFRRVDVDVVVVGASSPRHVDELAGWFARQPPDPGLVGEMEAALARTRHGSDAA